MLFFVISQGCIIIWPIQNRALVLFECLFSISQLLTSCFLKSEVRPSVIFHQVEITHETLRLVPSSGTLVHFNCEAYIGWRLWKQVRSGLVS